MGSNRTTNPEFTAVRNGKVNNVHLKVMHYLISQKTLPLSILFGI
jgi:hypothetical protein